MDWIGPAFEMDRVLYIPRYVCTKRFFWSLDLIAVCLYKIKNHLVSLLHRPTGPARLDGPRRHHLEKEKKRVVDAH